MGNRESVLAASDGGGDKDIFQRRGVRDAPPDNQPHRGVAQCRKANASSPACEDPTFAGEVTLEDFELEAEGCDFPSPDAMYSSGGQKSRE